MKLSDTMANVIGVGGVGAMLYIAGLPTLATIGIATFTLGGVAGIAIAKKRVKDEQKRCN